MTKKREHVVQMEEGKWYRIAHGKPPYEHYCCRCNLGHLVTFKVENGVAWEKWDPLPDRPKPRTKAARRKKE